VVLDYLVEYVLSICKYLDSIPADFQFEDGWYIDNITFNNSIISIESLYQKALQVEFDFKEEKFSNHI